MRWNKPLWVVQVLLTLLFLFAGITKLVLPLSAMQMPAWFPGMLLRFIGVCEVLGALGLVLPGLTRIRTGLTPLAAAGLVIIMIGATTITVMGGTIALALFPFITGVLAACVAYGRWRVAPLPSRSTVPN